MRKLRISEMPSHWERRGTPIWWNTLAKDYFEQDQSLWRMHASTGVIASNLKWRVVLETLLRWSGLRLAGKVITQKDGVNADLQWNREGFVGREWFVKMSECKTYALNTKNTHTFVFCMRSIWQYVGVWKIENSSQSPRRINPPHERYSGVYFASITIAWAFVRNRKVTGDLSAP